MRRRHKFVVAGSVFVLLFVLGVPQLWAQSSITLESLSRRIDAISSRLNALNRNSAQKSEVAALQRRVATLEAQIEDATPVATATRRRPTATPTRRPPTPTRVRPTATPTPAQAYIRITRNMNVRRGPDTTYAVVGYATVGQEYDITGRNTDGSWWRIEFEGENAWIYAPFVTAVNARGIRVAPTPVPPPTPTPQTQFDLYELAYFVLTLDQESIGRGDSWKNTSTAKQAEVVEVMSKFLLATSDYCDLSVYEMTELIYKYGAVVDESGFSLRNGYAPRTNLLYELIQHAEEHPRHDSCDQLMEWRVILLLAEE